MSIFDDLTEMQQTASLSAHDLTKAVWSEAELCAHLGMKKSQLAYQRLHAGFPYVRIGRTLRVYLALDVLAWLGSKRYRQNTAPESSSEG